MISGRLDRRLVVQVKTEAISTSGFRTNTWATHLSIWGMRVHEKGTEQTDDNNRTVKRKVKYRVRYHSTITDEMRIKEGGDWYEIEDIKELGHQDGLLIFTRLLVQT